MQFYTVHTQPSFPEAKRLSEAVFVRDGFHLVALIAPPLWLLWYRQWLGLMLYIAALIVLDFATEFASVWSLSVLNFLFGIGIALEASTLRRWRLHAKGWRLTDVVSAYDIEDAEERFFAGLAHRQEAPAKPTPSTSGVPTIGATSATNASTPNIIGYQ